MNPDAAVALLAQAPHLLVALDFDGTVSELADDPMGVRMTDAARHAVGLLSALENTTVAFVSGRSLDDLRVIAEHDDDSAILLVGSHGAERWVPGEPSETDISPDERGRRDELRTAAERLVADVPGAWIEPKTFGFAVPSRLVDERHRDGLHARVDDMMDAEAPRWRRRTGHNIVEYAFRDVGKDAAVAWLRARTDASAVLFAGDDVTDEDALGSLRAGDVGIHVGAGESVASVRVPDIDGLAAILEAVADARRAHDGESQRE